jgi:hypothetical protein
MKGNAAQPQIMARKLKPNEEQAFREAARFAEFDFNAEGFHAYDLRWALNHPFFEQQPPSLSHFELLSGKELPPDDWF